MQRLESLDWVIIILYFEVLLVAAYWVIRQKQKNTEDYFLAGINMGWFMVGASIFAMYNAIAIIVSMYYPAPSQKQLAGLTFGTVSEEKRVANKSSYTVWYIIASAFIVLIVLHIMISFSALTI
jgi:SSS family solute:Na+ symporter